MNGVSPAARGRQPPPTRKALHHEDPLPRPAKPGATFEKYQPHLLDVVHHPWAAYKSGPVREIYFRQDRPGVASMAEAASVDEAKKALADFPLVKAGLIDMEAIPLGAFVNWELLFAAASK